MARETRAAVQARVDPEGLLDRYQRELALLMMTATNADGTPFSLPISPGIGDSLQAAGKVTAPAAGAAIATLAAPPAGVYKVEIDVNVSAASDVNNDKVQRGGVDLYSPIAVVDKNMTEHEFRITLSGTQNLTVNAIIAGTAAVVYLAQIIATRVE